MPRYAGKTAYRTAFGKALDQQLRSSGTTQAALARVTNVSPSFVNGLMTGTRHISPEWAETVAMALGSSGEQKKLLHIAAAKTVGYKVDDT